MRTGSRNYSVGVFYSFGPGREIQFRNKIKTPFKVSTPLNIADFSPRRLKLNKAIEQSSNGFVLITPSLSCLGENISKISLVFEKVIYRRSGAIYLTDTNELIDRDSRVSLETLLFKLAELRQETRKQ